MTRNTFICIPRGMGSIHGPDIGADMVLALPGGCSGAVLGHGQQRALLSPV